MPDDPPVARLEATAFRYSNYDSPFWARNNRSAGRWNRPDEDATQYLSLHPEGAWAELLRRENLKTEGEINLVRMTIWAAAIHEGHLADYSTFERAEAAGFPPAALIDDDYSRCQEEAARLRARGFGGLITPNAALPGATNVVIFGRRVLATWGVPARLASSIPACKVAIGCPAVGLAARVRYFGESHSGYAAYAMSVEGHANESAGLQADEETTRVRRLPEQKNDE